MRTELIAEIAQAHDGSLGIAHSYIDMLAELGVSAVKFQMHIADAESSQFEQFRINFSYEDVSRFEYWKRMEFSFEQWAELKRHAEDKGLEFICSPFSIEAFEQLEKLGVKRHKVASGEVENFLMLMAMCRSGKPILLSSGMSSYDDLEMTVRFIRENKGQLDTVFQCTTSYPTPPEKTGLNVIPELINRFGVRVGLSDHSAEIWPHIGAYMLGASVFEFHVVFDRRMFGPDATSSLEPLQVRELRNALDYLEKAKSHPVEKADNAAFNALRANFGKSLSLRCDVVAGMQVEEHHLETRKPAGMGLPANAYPEILGKVYTRDLKRTEFINSSDLK
jgi:N,N'-diacetyllegionaminate synthase